MAAGLILSFMSLLGARFGRRGGGQMYPCSYYDGRAHKYLTARQAGGPEEGVKQRAVDLAQERSPPAERDLERLGLPEWLRMQTYRYRDTLCAAAMREDQEVCLGLC